MRARQVSGRRLIENRTQQSPNEAESRNCREKDRAGLVNSLGQGEDTVKPAEKGGNHKRLLLGIHALPLELESNDIRNGRRTRGPIDDQEYRHQDTEEDESVLQGTGQRFEFAEGAELFCHTEE
jgi:hypothetical protein